MKENANRLYLSAMIAASACTIALAGWFAFNEFQVDAFSFYEGWRLTAAGRSPYFNHVDDYSRALPNGRMTMLRYPPAFFAAWPLAYVPYAQAKVLWTLGLLIAMGAQVVAAWRCFGVRAAALSAALFLTFPMFWALECGQSDILIAALCAVFACCYLTNRRRWAAATLATAIAVKVTPAFLMVYLAARRDWRTLGLTLLITFALSAAGAALVTRQSPTCIADYITVLQHRHGYGGMRAERVGIDALAVENDITFEGHTYRYTMARVGTYMSVSLASVTGISDMVAVLLGTCALAAIAWRGRADLALVAFLLGICILNPAGWGTGFVMAIPAVVIAFRRGLGREGYAFAALAALIFLPRIGPWDWHEANEAARCAAVAGMIFILARHALRRRRGVVRSWSTGIESTRHEPEAAG